MKNIEKQYILKTIRNNNNKCLIEPENPFSLDNPNVFVYRNNALYAIFIPTFMEKENFDHLLRRLYISQLSCGTKFVPILLWNEEQELPRFTFKCLENSFAHITKDIKDLMKYIDKGEKSFGKWKNFSRLQQNHYIDWQLRVDFSTKIQNGKCIQDDSIDIQGLNTINFEVVKNMESWSEQGKSWYTKKYLRSEYGDIARCNKNSNDSFGATFQKIMTMSFKNMYFFSDGYIELNKNVLSRIRVIDTDWELFSEDIPNKYHRMLSFVGLSPVKMKATNEIGYLSDKYQTMYEFNRKKH